MSVISIACNLQYLSKHYVSLLEKSRYLIMESRFAHLRQRDTSVSMLRVKMSRRRSHSQKENRERTVNTRRQLDKLPELEMSSLNASIAVANMSTIQEKTKNNEKPAKGMASQFFKKMDCSSSSWFVPFPMLVTPQQKQWKIGWNSSSAGRSGRLLRRRKRRGKGNVKGCLRLVCIIQREPLPHYLLSQMPQQKSKR